MYRKKKDKKKSIISLFIILIVLLALLSGSLLITRNKNTFLKDGVILIEKLFMYPFTALNKEKNETQTESYTIQKNVNESLEKEIQE